eukprot:Skav204665  [mRNA]  locus=scaffold607:103460:112749:- [translate_table: standard]
MMRLEYRTEHSKEEEKRRFADFLLAGGRTARFTWSTGGTLAQQIPERAGAGHLKFRSKVAEQLLLPGQTSTAPCASLQPLSLLYLLCVAVTKSTLKGFREGLARRVLETRHCAKRTPAVWVLLKSAVAHIHYCGVIHRDIKAPNIILTGASSVRLAEFGSACRSSSEDWRRDLVGSLTNLAPEALPSPGQPQSAQLYRGMPEILELRAMELKHGRVAMLAVPWWRMARRVAWVKTDGSVGGSLGDGEVLGWFHVAAGYHIVGDYAVGEHLDNNPLVNLTQLPMGGVWQVVFTIMCLEWLTTYVCKPPAEKPWDILGWTDAWRITCHVGSLGLVKDIIIEDEKSIWNQFRKAELQELNNGRLAMMGITGLIAQDGARASPGHPQGPWPQDVLFGDFGEAAVLPCFGASVCKELFSPVGPEATTEPFFPGATFIYPPLAHLGWTAGRGG